MNCIIIWLIVGILYLFYRKIKNTRDSYFTLFDVIEILLFSPLFPVFMFFDLLIWSKNIKLF